MIIVNEALARRMFPDEDPIGKHIWRWRVGGDSREIVGVVQNVSFYDVTDQDRPLVYVPHRQDMRGSMVLAVRAAGDPLLVADSARNAIWSIDNDLAVAGLATMEQAADGIFSRSRFIAILAGGFAVVALLLALVGVYGVISHAVTQRKHEFGVRMALGAQAGDILGLVMRQALTLTIVGVGIGMLAAVALAQTFSSLLFEVSTTDPGTPLSIALALSLAAFSASYFPARRATKIDPMMALRCE